MNKERVKKLIPLFVIVCVGISIVLYYVLKPFPNEEKIKKILVSYGLEETKIKYSAIGPEDHYTFIYKGKDTITYQEIFRSMKDVDNISWCVFVDKFVCGKDEYKINKEAGVVLLNGYAVYTDHEYLAEWKALKEKMAETSEAIQNTYKDRYPFVGMRENSLCNTKLGDPDSIEYCHDFSKLQTRARYKTYTWNNTEYGKYTVTVRYRQHHSHRVDDYTDLPTDNGYVDSISYHQDGNLINKYYHETLQD